MKQSFVCYMCCSDRFVQIHIFGNLTKRNMEPNGCWMHSSLSSNAHVTNNHHWLLSDKQYVDGTLPSYMCRTSALRTSSDIGSSTDTCGVERSRSLYGINGQFTSRPQYQQHQRSHFRSNCIMPAPVHDGVRLSTSDQFCSDADSTGMTLSDECVVDHSGDLAATDQESRSIHSQPDVIVNDSDGEVNALGDSSVCSVCGDVAAGFHCGAYVCEACKVRTEHPQSHTGFFCLF